MKLTIEKAQLLVALGRAQGATQKKTTMPILSCVLIEAKENTLVVTATDLEAFSSGRYSAHVAEQGKACLAARPLYDWVSSLGGESVSIKIDGTKLKVESENGRDAMSFPTVSADDFPRAPGFEFAQSTSMSRAALITLLARTSYAAADDDPRPILNGVYFAHDGTTLRAVATDANRMALAECEAPALGASVIVPRRAARELAKLLDQIEADPIVSASQAAMRIEWPAFSYTTRTIEGDYPDYTMIVPKYNPRPASANAETLAAALKRHARMDKNSPIRLRIDKRAITLESGSSERGDARSEIDTDYSGDPLEIGANARYLLDAIDGLECESVDICASDASAPIVLRPSEPSADMALVMPVRI